MHYFRLCPACKGAGHSRATPRCGVCQGYRVVAVHTTPCPNCKGNGTFGEPRATILAGNVQVMQAVTCVSCKGEGHVEQVNPPKEPTILVEAETVEKAIMFPGYGSVTDRQLAMSLVVANRSSRENDLAAILVQGGHLLLAPDGWWHLRDGLGVPVFPNEAIRLA